METFLDPLYRALDDERQCKYLLYGCHKETQNGELVANTQESFAAAIRKLEGSLGAQLTAAACLVRLCHQVSRCCYQSSSTDQASLFHEQPTVHQSTEASTYKMYIAPVVAKHQMPGSNPSEVQ